MSVYTCSLWFMIVFIPLSSLHTQSPYKLDKDRELTFFGAGASSLGLGFYQKSLLSPPTASELRDYSLRDISAFDAISIDNFSASAAKTSDLTMNASFSVPALLFLDKRMRKDIKPIATMWAEVILINSGLTSLTKYTIQRPRPHLLNPNTDPNEEFSVNSRASFFSGHTSTTAANTFFAAKVFSDYYPDSKLKPFVWGAAITLPAITGAMRVKAGRHFPSDVIVGYAVGAAVGYLVPHFHKRKNRNINISFSAY